MLAPYHGSRRECGEGIAVAFVDKMVFLWLVVGMFHALTQLQAPVTYHYTGTGCKRLSAFFPHNSQDSSVGTQLWILSNEHTSLSSRLMVKQSFTVVVGMEERGLGKPDARNCIRQEVRLEDATWRGMCKVDIM